MKSLSKLVVFGTLALTVIFFWERNRPAPVQIPAAVEPAPAPIAPVATVAPEPVVYQTYRPPPPADPFADAMALVHLKLCQWRESLRNDPDADEYRSQLLKDLLALVTDGNVVQVIQALSAQELDTPFGTGALRRWLQLDPTTASIWMASRPGAAASQTSALADYWSTNSSGVQQFVDAISDPAYKQQFLQQTSEEMSHNDPQDAIKLAQQLPPGSAQTNVLQAVASNWITTDPNAALDYINSVTDPAMKDQLTAAAAQSYALTDPAQAAAWLVSSVNSDEVVNQASLNILQTWVTMDPAQAANWVAQFPEGKMQATAVQIVSQYWQQVDPDAANTWLQNLSSAPAVTPN